VLIDWFTVAAQAVNFLVLVVVLKLVLFDRVVAAMDRREAAIAAQLRDAAAREAEAGAEAEGYRARRHELEREREGRLRQAEAAAAARRAELIDDARAEVDQLRAGWERALLRDRAHLMEEVRRRTGEQACTISRRALADLSGTDLETRMVRAALRRLQGEADQLAPLVAEGAAGRPVSVRSAFPLAPDLAGEVVKVVSARLGRDESDVELARDPGLVCGLEIRVGAWSVGWSIDGYLDGVEDALEALLPEDRAGDDGPGGGT
jgi:F-type H+-transporting ATPase subunit b